MYSFGKELERRISTRKTAMENLGIEENSNQFSENNEDRIGQLLRQLNDNIQVAEENSFQNGYWHISGKRTSIYIKKVLRKLLWISFGWFIFPIMNRQSLFNGKIINSMNSLKDIASFQQELIKELIQQQKNNSMEEMEPGLELGIRRKNDIIINDIGNLELKTKTEQIQYASAEDVEDKIKLATECYKNEIQIQIKRQHTDTRKLIVVFCLRFGKEHGIEAIKNEAYDLFKLLRCESIYNVKLVSLEQDANNYQSTDEILYFDEDNLQENIKKISPDLIILCESTPYNFLDFNGIFVKYHTIIKLTGQNPLQNFSEQAIAEMRHACDYGINKYLVESRYAYNVMVQNGFREVVLSYPVIDIDRVKVARNRRDNRTPFIIGFASLPMEEKQFIDRGMDIFIEVVKQRVDIIFKVLWRNEFQKVPKELEDAKNCQIHMGKYDMNLFYQEIDCIIIPYKTTDNNHACSLSGIEAMLNNIPVISTEVAGISDLVRTYEMGIVCSPDSESVITALDSMVCNYEVYIEQFKSKAIYDLFNSKEIVSIVENSVEDYFPRNFVTLEEWDYHLRMKNKYLVKGHNEIKKYYQNIEVADNYNEVRFLQYPANYYDAFERVSIEIAINNYFDNTNLEILDIASGDGRIVQEDIKYGKCTSIDSSRAMLNIVENRFASRGTLTTQICDYFVDVMEGQYDVITTFRYIRHYDYLQRKILYKRIHNNLKKGGMLIFDAPNIRYAMENRKSGNWGDYNIYDVFYSPESIIREMEQNNFTVKYMIPIGVKTIEPEPVSWTIAAVKN